MPDKSEEKIAKGREGAEGKSNKSIGLEQQPKQCAHCRVSNQVTSGKFDNWRQKWS